MSEHGVERELHFAGGHVDNEVEIGGFWCEGPTSDLAGNVSLSRLLIYRFEEADELSYSHANRDEMLERTPDVDC